MNRGSLTLFAPDPVLRAPTERLRSGRRKVAHRQPCPGRPLGQPHQPHFLMFFLGPYGSGDRPDHGPATARPRTVTGVVHSGSMTVPADAAPVAAQGSRSFTPHSREAPQVTVFQSPSPRPRRVPCSFVPPYLLLHLATDDHPSAAA